MKMNEVIRKYRKEWGLTQEQVAGYLGYLHRRSISGRVEAVIPTLR